MSVEMIKQQALLEKLLKKIENKECADCRTKSPSWASILFGTFICIRCSGFHRELSTSYAKVKSVDLDKWPNGVAELYTKINNNIANKYWEYKLENNEINLKKLKDDDNYLRDYIFDKYQRKRWAAKGKCPMTRLYEGEDISNINYNDNLSKQSSSTNDKKEVDIKKTFSSKSNVSNGIKEKEKEKTNDLKISEVTDDIFNFDSSKGNGNGNEQKYKFGFIDKNKSNENQTLSSTSKTNDCKSITDDIFNFSTKKEETKPKDEFDFGFETKDDKLSKLLCQIDGNSNDCGKNNVKGNNSTNDIFNMMNPNNNGNGNLDHQKYLANNINFNATNINVNNNYYNSFNLGSNMNHGFNNTQSNSNYGYNKNNNNRTFNNNYFDNNQYINVNQTQGKTLNKNQDPNSKIQLNYDKVEYSKNSKSSNDLFGDFQDLKKKDSNTNGNKKGDPFSDLLKL